MAGAPTLRGTAGKTYDEDTLSVTLFVVE